MNHWLLKSEPGTFSVDDLAAAPRRTTAWDGVRNYQARNTLRDSMKKGDTAFFYHSSGEPPGVARVAWFAGAGRLAVVDGLRLDGLARLAHVALRGPARSRAPWGRPTTRVAVAQTGAFDFPSVGTLKC